MTTDNQPAETPPVKIAFVLDGQVADILHTDERLASIFLSNPIIIDVTGNLYGSGGTVNVGASYNEETKEFTPHFFDPEPEIIEGGAVIENGATE